MLSSAHFFTIPLILLGVFGVELGLREPANVYDLHYKRSPIPKSKKQTEPRHTVANTNLTYVVDSGVCETTPGVHQVSGYVHVKPEDSMWFWFFESRNSPDTAPFTLWFNGGPGCTGMLGLFRENGPCNVNSDKTTTTLNPFSWNQVSNMMFIDQPIGSGFSQGTTNISTSQEAAEYLWQAMQLIFADKQFSKYLGRDFIIATESYAARFAAPFANYFNEQNGKIDSGEVTGIKIPVTALAINNGEHDPLTQFGSTALFTQDAPGYGELAPVATITDIQDAFINTCQPQLLDCADQTARGAKTADETCKAANNNCLHKVFNPSVGTRDPEDLRQQDNSTTPFPTLDYTTFIRDAAIMKQIGATTTFDQCNDDVQDRFLATGESGRSSLPPLAQLANAKLPILIWVGDADLKANWFGVHDAMVNMSWYGNLQLNQTEFTNMTIGGNPVAQFKTVDNFSFVRVFGAGHAMPAFQPQTALEIYSQFLSHQPLHSVDQSAVPTGSVSIAAPDRTGVDVPSAARSSICIPRWKEWMVLFGLVSLLQLI